MADPDIDWRSYERWRVPNVEEVLFPFWFNETVSEDAYISQIECPDEKEKQLQLLNENALRKLNSLIHSDEVVFFARVADPKNDIERLSLSYFHSVHSWSFQRHSIHNESIIQLAAGEHITTYYDVHIFPLMVAPGYQKHLTGKIGPLIDKFVLNDRELINKTALTDIGLATWLEFEASAFPVRLSDDPEIVGQDVFEGLGCSRIRSSHRQSVGRVLVDRLVRLFGVMLSAEVSIVGRPWPSGPLQLLPLPHVDRAGYSLCLATKRLMLNGAPAWLDVRLLPPGSLLAASLPQATTIGADQVSARGDPAHGSLAAGDRRDRALDTGHAAMPEVKEEGEARRAGGRPPGGARVRALTSLIAERERNPAPLYESQVALAEELLKREWAFRKGMPIDGDECRRRQFDRSQIDKAAEWIRDNAKEVRGSLAPVK